MRLFTATLLLAFSLTASAGNGRTDCRPTVTGAWVRMAPGMSMGAAFGVIRNACATPIEITGVSSPGFADVSLHETRIEKGMSRMRAVPALPVRARSAVELRPGGLHVMLMQPRTPSSRTVRIEFLLGDGRRVSADMPVRAAAR